MGARVMSKETPVAGSWEEKVLQKKQAEEALAKAKQIKRRTKYLLKN